MDTIQPNSFKTGIGRKEFAKVMDVLVASTFERVLAQTSLKFLCPLTSCYVWRTLRFATAHIWAQLPVQMPSLVIDLAHQVPPSLPQTLVCGIMMTSVPLALDLIDTQTEKRAATVRRRSMELESHMKAT